MIVTSVLTDSLIRWFVLAPACTEISSRMCWYSLSFDCSMFERRVGGYKCLLQVVQNVDRISRWFRSSGHLSTTKFLICRKAIYAKLQTNFWKPCTFQGMISTLLWSSSSISHLSSLPCVRLFPVGQVERSIRDSPSCWWFTIRDQIQNYFFNKSSKILNVQCAGWPFTRS